jgi:hypothetical protein
MKKKEEKKKENIIKIRVNYTDTHFLLGEATLTTP